MEESTTLREKEMNNILEAIVKVGGKPVKVGGCVRDKVLGITNKDIDIEVFGLDINSLVSTLSAFGKVCIVGESFGVIKLTTCDGEFDFSLPRRDSKNGVGHTGFNVEIDHTMTVEEAAFRRDFTINTLSETIDGEILDPFGGVNDIKNGTLRATSKHFCEDPLRVLRGFQFASRFKLVADDETLQLCRTMFWQAHELPVERVWGEWFKWALRGIKPSLGLDFLVESFWIYQHPELCNIIDVAQDPEWHPEGCAWTHTKFVCDAAAVIADREGLQGEDRAVIILAALCHDLGKAYPDNGGTTAFEDGRWRSRGHAEAGVPLAESFLKRIGCLDRMIERILPLVAEHMISASNDVSERTVRRLASRMGKATINELLWIIEADHNGRPPLPGGLPESALFIADVAARFNLERSKPKPIIGGKHLLALGFTPGPNFGKILKVCFDAQLDGDFHDEPAGLSFLEYHVAGISRD